MHNLEATVSELKQRDTLCQQELSRLNHHNEQFKLEIQSHHQENSDLQTALSSALRDQQHHQNLCMELQHQLDNALSECTREKQRNQSLSQRNSDIQRLNAQYEKVNSNHLDKIQSLTTKCAHLQEDRDILEDLVQNYMFQKSIGSTNTAMMSVPEQQSIDLSRAGTGGIRIGDRLHSVSLRREELDALRISIDPTPGPEPSTTRKQSGSVSVQSIPSVSSRRGSYILNRIGSPSTFERDTSSPSPSPSGAGNNGTNNRKRSLSFVLIHTAGSRRGSVVKPTHSVATGSALKTPTTARHIHGGLSMSINLDQALQGLPQSPQETSQDVHEEEGNEPSYLEDESRDTSYGTNCFDIDQMQLQELTDKLREEIREELEEELEDKIKEKFKLEKMKLLVTHNEQLAAQNEQLEAQKEKLMALQLEMDHLKAANERLEQMGNGSVLMGDDMDSTPESQVSQVISTPFCKLNMSHNELILWRHSNRLRWDSLPDIHRYLDRGGIVSRYHSYLAM